MSTIFPCCEYVYIETRRTRNSIWSCGYSLPTESCSNRKTCRDQPGPIRDFLFGNNGDVLESIEGQITAELAVNTAAGPTWNTSISFPMNVNAFCAKDINNKKDN